MTASNRFPLRSVLAGLLGVNFVILVHEFGHWLMCHYYGVGTPEFAIGLGPTLARFSAHGTQFILGLFPLGGYVEILGARANLEHLEAAKEVLPAATLKTLFATQTLSAKMLILLGGILANILLGCTIIALLIYTKPQKPAAELEALETEIQEDPAFRGGSGIMGPLGIIYLLSHSTRYGFRFFLNFIAILSLNLAIFNLIPLPLLDGGQLLLTILEHVFKHTIDKTSYDLLMIVTMAILTIIALLATQQDVRRFFARR